MAMQSMNAASEMESLLNPPETPDLKRDAEGRFLPAEKVEAKEPKVEEEAPEWVKRYNITPEQKKGVEEIISKAINKKHGQAKEAEEFAAEQYNQMRLAEQRAEAFEKELAAFKAQQTPKVDELAEPKRDAFDNDEKYLDARAEWIAERKFREREVKAEQQRAQEHQAQVIATAKERIDAAKALVPDWEEVVTSQNDMMIPAHIGAYMQEAELLPELAYHFAQNPDLLTKLSKMKNSAAALVELGKIESRLQPFAKSDAKVPVDLQPEALSEATVIPSQARAYAPVIQPLNVGSGNQVEKPASKMSYAESKADYQKRNGRNFSIRKRH